MIIDLLKGIIQLTIILPVTILLAMLGIATFG